MGSHVDTPEWQSFERRVRERSLARRRRLRLRWMVVIGGAILIGVNLKPPGVHRPSTPPASSSIESLKAASAPQRASAVTVLRVPFAATVIAEQASAVPAIETTGYAALPPSSQLSLPGAAAPEPEAEPRPEPGNEPAPEAKREPEPKPLAPLGQAGTNPGAEAGASATNARPGANGSADRRAGPCALTG